METTIEFGLYVTWGMSGTAVPGGLFPGSHVFNVS